MRLQIESRSRFKLTINEITEIEMLGGAAKFAEHYYTDMLSN